MAYSIDDPNVLTTQTQRHLGIDLGRLIGCFTVILLHQNAAPYGGAGLVHDAIDQLCRWAVPFFFIASGYFLGQQSDMAKMITRAFVRIGPIFIAWCLFYHFAAGWSLRTLTSPEIIIALIQFGGSGYHLWFLSALILGTTVAAPFIVNRKYVLLGVIGVLAFTIGLVLGPYSPLLCGEYKACAVTEPRNGVTFGLLFLAIGVLARVGYLDRLVGRGWLLVVFGLGLSALEAYGLNAIYGVPPKEHDFLIGTVLVAMGSWFIFFNTQIGNETLARVVNVIGPVTLGIYVSHLFFLQQLNQLGSFNSLGAALAISIIVFLLAALTSLLGSRWRVTRRFFM